MKWKAKEVENLVREIFGDAAGEAVQGPCQSFGRKQQMTYYHANETKRIWEQARAESKTIDPEDSESVAGMKAIFECIAAPDETWNYVAIQVESHTIASAQAMHSSTVVGAMWEFQI